MAGTSVFGFAESDSEDELPSGWEERTTLDGRVFYANHSDRATQWNHPRTGKRKRLVGDLPPGWQRKVLDDGKVVFFNTREHRETFIDPRLAFAVEEQEPDAATGARPRQRFDASTKAMQILHAIDLANRTALITGGNSGIGFETARCLALHGCHVVIACRSVARGEEARDRIVAQRATAKVDVIECDLASLRSVRRCAQEFVTRGFPLHLLVLNAGVIGVPFTLTEDGFETTFQVNHLGHFYLTKLLVDVLVRSAPARVVVVSSESHRFLWSPLTPETLDEQRLSPSTPAKYWWMEQYNLSKLANVLFAIHANARLQPLGVTVNALHPGNMVSTGVARNSWLLSLAYKLVRPFTKSLEQAAATSVYAACAPELEKVGGVYLNNCWLCEPSKAAQDVALQRRFWELSEEMVERTMK